jgi:hypothetical protein
LKYKEIRSTNLNAAIRCWTQRGERREEKRSMQASVA